jgi:hypothetical protein
MKVTARELGPPVVFIVVMAALGAWLLTRAW